MDPRKKYPVTLPDGKTWKNTVLLNNVIDHPNITIGDYTYYNNFNGPFDDYARELFPYCHIGGPDKIIIGRFVQIAHGTQFITSSANHQMDGFSTYPFAIFGPPWQEAYTPNWPYKGDTVIGHDVWFGHHSFILPAVNIGSGSIIAAHSVVTKDIPPYSIVAGNPAKIVRQRFDDLTIDSLIEIAWWDWPIDVISNHIDVIVGADLSRLKEIHKSRP